MAIPEDVIREIKYRKTERGICFGKNVFLLLNYIPERSVFNNFASRQRNAFFGAFRCWGALFIVIEGRL